jgi:hypothetical protein
MFDYAGQLEPCPAFRFPTPMNADNLIKLKADLLQRAVENEIASRRETLAGNTLAVLLLATRSEELSCFSRILDNYFPDTPTLSSQP